MVQIKGREHFNYVQVNALKTTQDACDEWITTASIDFLLHPSKVAEIELFSEKDLIIGVRLCNRDYYDDEFCLVYLKQTDPDGEHPEPIFGLDVSAVLAKELHAIISEEERKGKRGWLKNHTFSDDESLWDVYHIEPDETAEVTE